MKRIWFSQQKPFNYTPLRMGLGYLQAKEIYNIDGKGVTYLPKIYTTRTHKLSGEYYVVEGSRFKAKPVESGIEFQVNSVALLDLAEGLVCPIHNGEPEDDFRECLEILDKNGLTFAELDLGFKGATYKMLLDVLLQCNPRTTINTPFYVNLLEPVERQK